MKTKFLLFSLLLSGLFSFQSVSAQNITFDDGATWKCDQFFDARPLRYMKTYQFYDEWINEENKSVYLNNYAVKYKNANYLTVGQLFSGGEEFYWTQLLIDYGYRVPPRTQMPVLSTRAQDWGVVRHPSVRSNGVNQWDFLIGYKIDYDYSNNYPNASDDKSHVECQPYYVTWCGDGVLDPQYEQCDGTAGVPAGQSCTASCTLTSAPACINLSASVQVGNAPLSTNVSCQTQNAASVAIDCGNGQTINGANGTCTYTQSGTYQAVCRVNGTITNNNCQKPITVTPPPTEITNFDLRIKKYAKGEDVFASVENTEDFNYNIVVQNVGPERTSNTTTVVDTLPTGVVLRAAPSGNGWNCSGTAGQQTFSCTTTAVVDPNQVFNVISVPVRVTNLAFRPEAYVNYAYVHNPNEMVGRRCNADGSMPNSLLGGNNGQTPTNVCNQDTNNFDPATVSPPNPNGFDLRLKKYVNGDDESARANSTVNYTFQVQNLGALASTGRTTVTDSSFPNGITIQSIAATQGEWACTQNSTTAFTCFTDRIYAVGEFSSTITVVANVPANLAVGAHRNVACLSNPNDPHENAVLNPALGLYKVNNCDPAEVYVVPAGSFDLMIKKYVADTTSGTEQRYGDHQTTNDGSDVDRDILTVPQNGTMRYRFFVRNLGPVTATGTTTVEDTFPDGLIIDNVGGAGWSCTSPTTRSFICSRQDTLAMGAEFPEIVANARPATATAVGEYTNIATVRNPGDTNPTNNVDPANVQILAGPACGTLGGVPAAQVSPGTVTTYTCSALGYTGATTNLEYQFNCGTGTGAWSSSNTGSCAAPSAQGASQLVSCGVRDITNSGVVFTGSFAGSCQGTVRTTTSGGGASHVGKICINNVATCATFNSIIACQQSGARNCYSADSSGIISCQNESLSCSGNGGGGGGGYCGDGVLQAGEECDIRGGNSDSEGALCSASCKLRVLTTPGANPITQLWMTIPTLSRARLGYSFLDNIPGRIAFEKNGVVVGQQSKVFTLADVVGFGLTQRYQIPLMIEAEKQICLQGSGEAVDNKALCTTFGAAAEEFNRTSNNTNRILTWTRPTDGKPYVVIGNGDFQYQEKINGTYFVNSVSGNSHEVNLFKGSSLYQVPSGGSATPNSTFQGQKIGANGAIALVSNETTLAALPVRVSGVLVGTTATPVNRSIQRFVINNSQMVLSGFLGESALSIRNTTSNSSTTNNTSTNTAVINIPNTNIWDGTIRSLADFQNYKLNGNANVFAIKGNVTIDSCETGVFMQEGVRTVIVEGNLRINCNIWYKAGDTTASWAWIVKGGDIIIDQNVTNLAGVYVNIDGKIDGTVVTSKILKIDGSMYGNASGLFEKHLYARGTNAYEILTTGTIITYSNRALVNPPPLLSQYLNNYSVSRVSQ